MSALNILIGGESFREIRERNCYYVDKTDLLEELLTAVPPKASLITRPRRFGKTLTMSMLREFFDIQKGSRDIFEGLKIDRNKELCEAWMNKHPVFYISLKRVEGLSFAEALAGFRELISLQSSESPICFKAPSFPRVKKKLCTAFSAARTIRLFLNHPYSA